MAKIAYWAIRGTGCDGSPIFLGEGEFIRA